MSDTVNYPAEGVGQLVIDTLARDAVVRGAPGATVIQVLYRADRSATPEFLAEGRGVRFARASAERVLVPPDIPVMIKEALGDVRVQGMASEVQLENVHGDLRLERVPGRVLLAQSEGDVRAEEAAELRILGACHGDLRFGGGKLTAESVGGDVRIGAAEQAWLARIHGDLWVEKLAGPLEVRSADGDVRLADVQGPVALNVVAGDLRAAMLLGGLQAAKVNGDVVLVGPFGANAPYSVVASGDIHAHLPPDADVRVTVQAMGRIRSDLPMTPAADGSPSFSATLGNGTARLNLIGADVRLTHSGGEEASGWEPGRREREQVFSELNSLSDRIRQQVTASLAAAGINIDTGDLNLGRGFRGWRGPKPGRTPAPPVPPERPRPPAPPGTPERPRTPEATAEEKLAILRMLHEGRITPEEADMLLKALGS